MNWEADSELNQSFCYPIQTRQCILAVIVYSVQIRIPDLPYCLPHGATTRAYPLADHRYVAGRM